jgi:hypothetical protein
MAPTYGKVTAVALSALSCGDDGHAWETRSHAGLKVGVFLAEQRGEGTCLFRVEAEHHARTAPWVVDRVGDVTGDRLGDLFDQAPCAPPLRPRAFELARGSLGA